MSFVISWFKRIFGFSKNSEPTNVADDENQPQSEITPRNEGSDSSGESTKTKAKQQIERCLNSENNNTKEDNEDNEDNTNEHLHSVRIDFDVPAEFVKKIRTKAAKKEMKPIFGLTVLRQELFIVTQFSEEIEVYDSKSLEFRRQVSIKGLFDPIDIASCRINNCLYIFDWIGSDKGEILKTDSTGNVINRWSTGSDGGFISVTREGHLILSVWERYVLREYSPDGQVISEIELPAVEGLRFGVKLSNDQYVVVHGETDTEDHRVCLVDGKGAVTRSVGGRQGLSDAEFNNPAYLAVDRSGFVLIADQNNKRVLLLNPELNFKRELIGEENGLRYPVRLELDSSTGRLFVADSNYNDNQWKDGSVMVFDFKPMEV